MNKITSRNILIVCILITLYFVVSVRWLDKDGTNWKGIIGSDGAGYYQYLNALFIEKNISNQKADGRYLLENNGNVANIYTVGPAFLISPFFAEGYLYQKLFIGEIDKYGLFFQLEVSIAALFYLTLGLIFFRKSLIYFNIRDNIIALLLPIILFGTNLFYYTVIEPSMSHVYSFFTISFFVFSVLLFKKYGNPKHIILMAISLALTILIRPSNALIILFIPFLTDNLEELILFLRRIFTNKNKLLLSILVFLLIVFIQPLMWKLQTGNWFLWSYKSSGFYFNSPEIFNLLFSFRKGLFIYTPLVLISLIGLLFIFKNNKYRFISFLLAFSVLIYFTASWWNWYYGDSFGMRPIIDFYAVLFIPLAIFLQNYKKYFKIIMPIISLFIVLNLVQTYQYYYLIMSKYDMNFEKYKYIFFKTSKEKYQNSLGGNIDIAPYHKKPMNLFYSDFDKSKYEISQKNHRIKLNLDKLNTDKSLYIKLDFRVLFENENSNDSKILLQLIDRNNKSYYNYAMKINDIPKYKVNEFSEREFRIQLPPFHEKAEFLRLSFIGIGGKVFVKDIDLKVLYPNNS